MSSLMFPFYGVKENIATIVIAAGGTIVMFVALKKITEIKKTKNTAGLNKKFMQWYLPTCILLALTSILSIIETCTPEKGHKINVHWAVIDGFFIFMNGYLFCSCLYAYKIKKENIKSAELAKMSEEEYYEKVIAPSFLKVSITKSK